jgi:hypothetical protein
LNSAANVFKQKRLFKRPTRTPVRQDLIFWQQRRNQAVKLYFNYKKDFLFQQVVEKGLSARRKKRSSPPRTPVR